MKSKFLLGAFIVFFASHAPAILNGDKVAKNSLFSKRIARIAIQNITPIRSQSAEVNCTGVFIARDLVLTAAHCLMLSPFNKIEINISQFRTMAVRFLAHSMFRDPRLDFPYDIALLQTKDLLPMNDIVTPVNLEPSSNNYFIMIGFGYETAPVAVPSKRMTYTEVQVDPAMGMNSYAIELKSMEAGLLTYGDSGGPLLGLTKNGFSVFGVARGTSDRTHENIFASTYHNRDWILAVTKNLRRENASYWHSL